MFKISLVRLSIALAAILLAATASSLANAATPLNLEMTLVSSNTLTLGEPIVLQYKIANTSDQRLGMHLGLYKTEWYTLTLTDESGQTATPLPDLRPSQPSGAFASPNPFLGPQSVRQDFLVATRYFAITHPGKYTLTMHVHLPYAVVPASMDNSGDLERTLQSGGSVFTHDFVFPLVVTKPNSQQLQATAEALRQAIIQDQGGVRRQSLVEALFSMPEAQAAASWEALAADTNGMADIYRASAVQGLSQLHSSRAANMLESIIWSSHRSPDGATEAAARDALNQMYNTGDAQLKEHIRLLYDRHGIKVPANSKPIPSIFSD